MSPVRRTARMIRLLRERPHLLGELSDLLGVCGAQVRRDLADVRAEGWPLREQGGGPHQHKSVWIETTVEPTRVG